MPTFISKHLYKWGALTEELEFPLEKWNRFSTTIDRRKGRGSWWI